MTPEERIREWSRRWWVANRDPLFIRKLRDGRLTSEQIVVVLDTLDTVCNECWDAEEPCFCGSGYDI